MQLSAATVMLTPVAAVLPGTATAAAAASTTVRPTADVASAVPRVDTTAVLPGVAAVQGAGQGGSATGSGSREEPDPRTVRETYHYLQQLVSASLLGVEVRPPLGVRPMTIEPVELAGVIAYFEAANVLPAAEGEDVDALV